MKEPSTKRARGRGREDGDIYGSINVSASAGPRWAVLLFAGTFLLASVSGAILVTYR